MLYYAGLRESLELVHQSSGPGRHHGDFEPDDLSGFATQSIDSDERKRLNFNDGRSYNHIIDDEYFGQETFERQHDPCSVQQSQRDFTASERSEYRFTAEKGSPFDQCGHSDRRGFPLMSRSQIHSKYSRVYHRFFASGKKCLLKTAFD